MGNSSPTLQVLSPLSSSFIQHPSPSLSHLPPSLIPTTLLLNPLTLQQLHQYQIQLNLSPESLQSQLYKYNLRLLQNLNLVTVKSVQVFNNQATCSGNKGKMLVRTERIKDSLQGRRRGWGYEEGVKVLRDVLIGFKGIYQFEGYVEVREGLVFWNQKGEVKVWMNQKIWMNHPDRKILDNRYQSQFKPEYQMINRIFLIIQNHLFNPAQFNEIKNKIVRYGNTITFDKAIEIVREELENRNQKQSVYFNRAGNSGTGSQMLKRELESKGLKIVAVREERRYVEEPGQVEILKKGGYLKEGFRTEMNVKNHYLSPQPVRNLSPVPRITSMKQEQRIVNQSLENRIVSRQKPMHSILARNIFPNIKQQSRRRIVSLVDNDRSRSRSIRVNSRQVIKNEPILPRENKVIHHPRINSSPSPSQNHRKNQRSGLVSAPYFQSKPIIKQQPQYQIHPFPNNVVTFEQTIPQQKHEFPYINRQPIIQKNTFESLEMSKVSRISLNSHDSTNLSYKKLFSPTVYPQQIQQYKFVKTNEVETKLPVASSGYVKASLKQSFPSHNNHEPDLEIIVYPPPSNITQNNYRQQDVIMIEPVVQSRQVQVVQIPRSNNKHVGWVKINKKPSNYIVSQSVPYSNYRILNEELNQM